MIVTRSYPFEPGQAVVCDTARSYFGSRPIPLARAVVLRTGGITRRTKKYSGTIWETTSEFIIVQLLDADGAPVDKPRRMGASRFGYVGWCPHCELAAHQYEHGLACPQCGGPTPEPPPNRWLRRVFGEGNDHHPRMIAQALRTPDLTRNEIWKLIDAATWEQRHAFYAQFGLDQYAIDERHRRELDHLADLEDAEGFGRVAERAQRFQRNLNAILAFVQRMTEADEAADALEFGPAPAALAPLAPEQIEPDGEDDISRWLRAQAERHEQRKAA